MYHYRCYVLGSDMKIVSVEAASHPDDVVAITWAEAFLQKQPKALGVELWIDGRMVHRKIRE